MCVFFPPQLLVLRKAGVRFAVLSAILLSLLVGLAGCLQKSVGYQLRCKINASCEAFWAKSLNVPAPLCFPMLGHLFSHGMSWPQKVDFCFLVLSASEGR